MSQKLLQRISFMWIQATHESKTIARRPYAATPLRPLGILGLLLIGLLQTEAWAQAWQRIGPDYQPSEGLCYHVLPHPQRPQEHPKRLWLGMYSSGLNEPAGVWRSADGGES